MPEYVLPPAPNVAFSGVMMPDPKHGIGRMTVPRWLDFYGWFAEGIDAIFNPDKYKQNKQKGAPAPPQPPPAKACPRYALGF